MPKEEWGVKRVCPTTGKRFYDLGRSPIVSPYTGEVVNLETNRSTRTIVADKAEAKTKEAEEPLIEEEDDIDDSSSDDLDDELLEEDDDDDNVSLDDIADVSDDDDT
jgi:uncharacterized protein (TIGR02300 family)